MTSQEGEKLARKINAAFYETSAFTGYNIKSSIDSLVEETLSALLKKSISNKGYQESTRFKHGASVLTVKTHTTQATKKKSWAC